VLQSEPCARCLSWVRMPLHIYCLLYVFLCVYVYVCAHEFV
jgi:hypothetical protein